MAEKPSVSVEFKTLALTALQRSSKGTVVMILKDDTGSFEQKHYILGDVIADSDWTAENKDLIDKCFMGAPKEIYALRVSSSASVESALNLAKLIDFDYMCCPNGITQDQTDIINFIKGQRTLRNDIKFKAVVTDGDTADSEYIINFATDDIVVGGTTYSSTNYTSRIAGIIAGLPLNQSADYYELAEVESITESTDEDADLTNGKMILTRKSGAFRILAEINSLKTTSPDKGEVFQYVKAVEVMDMIRKDITDTFNKFYVGKVVNNYTNKINFTRSVTAYLVQLGNDGAIDLDAPLDVDIDTLAQKNYLESKGIDTSNMTEIEIRKYNTDKEVFIKAEGSILLTMASLKFVMRI